MNTLERQQTIIELLNKTGTVQASDLVERFGVTEMTIRRDLAMLERKGLLRRIRGGAVSSRGRSYEPPFMLRIADQPEEKKRIGRAAAALVENGDSIMLDVGTTTLVMAQNLINHQNLTVITPSFQIALLLVDCPGIRLILSGGILRPGELSLVGHLAERNLQDFYVDKVFLGVARVDLQAGYTEYNLEDTVVKQVMLRQGKDITVLADSKKFSEVAFTPIAPLQAANRIISDANLAPELAEKIREKGIELILA